MAAVGRAYLSHATLSLFIPTAECQCSLSLTSSPAMARPRQKFGKVEMENKNGLMSVTTLLPPVPSAVLKLVSC